MISQIYCTGKSSNEGKTQSYNILDSLSNYFFSLFAYKVIYLSRKILYTWQVAGVGAGLIAKNFSGGPTRLRAYYKSALRALEASLLFFIFFLAKPIGLSPCARKSNLVVIST